MLMFGVRKMSNQRIIRSKSSIGDGEEANNINIKKGVGTFTFPNGDRYEGGYACHLDKRVLVKQDYGIYKTENFDKYEAMWNGDKIKHNFYVRYSNGLRYRGGIDEEGSMNGHGIYTFPDGSSVAATWQKNKPILNVIYTEPLGFVWNGEYIFGETIFTPGNHFWNAICEETLSESLQGFTPGD